MRTGLKKWFIWAVVGVITLLLGMQLTFSYRNSKIIDENIRIRHLAESVKANTMDIIRALHLVDQKQNTGLCLRMILSSELLRPAIVPV